MNEDRIEGSRSRGSWRLAGPERVLFVLIVAGLVYQLLIPPIVGLADNGDGLFRVMSPLGLKPTVSAYHEKFWGHINRKYTIGPRSEAVIFSSEFVLCEVALLVNKVLSKDGLFDLAVLGGVHLSVYLGAVYLVLAAAQRMRGPARYVIGVSLVVVGTDVAYVSYFNSFYMESASLIFLSLLVGLALLCVRAARPKLWVATAYSLCAALFISAKPQNYFLAVPLALVPVSLLPRLGRRSRKMCAVALAVALICVAGALYVRIPRQLKCANLWNSVFVGLLDHSPSPREDLRELGLDPALERYVGEPAFDGAPVLEVTENYGFAGIGLFYVRHPMRLVALLQRSARQAFLLHYDHLGNFEKASGLAYRSRSHAFALWHRLRRAVLPKALWFLIMFFGAMGLAILAEIRIRGLSTSAGLTAVFCGVLAAMGALQFVICVLGDGTYELTKHLYLFEILFDACMIAAASWVCNQAWTVLQKRRFGREGGVSPDATDPLAPQEAAKTSASSPSGSGVRA